MCAIKVSWVKPNRTSPRTRASFLAELSVRSPRKILIFIIYKKIFRIKVSKKIFYLILKKEALPLACMSAFDTSIAAWMLCPDFNVCSVDVKSGIAPHHRDSDLVAMHLFHNCSGHHLFFSCMCLCLAVRYSLYPSGERWCMCTEILGDRPVIIYRTSVMYTASHPCLYTYTRICDRQVKLAAPAENCSQAQN